jgi:hypothetical protein
MCSHRCCSTLLLSLCCWLCCFCQVAIWSRTFWIVVWWSRQFFVLCCWFGQLPDWFAADCIVRCWVFLIGFWWLLADCCLLVLISMFRALIPYSVVFFWSREHVPFACFYVHACISDLLVSSFVSLFNIYNFLHLIKKKIVQIRRRSNLEVWNP